MRLPLLVLFSVSTTVTFKNDKQKKDDCGGQWDGSNLPKASMHFVVSLYKLVSSKTANAPPNFFLSPFSIYTTLAMLGLGARSSTQQQILDAMCLNASQADKILKDDFKNFLEKSRTKQGEVEFRFSNWLFLDKSFSLDTQYHQDLVNYYRTYIYVINFKDPLKAERIINEKISGHSDGKIEDLVSNVNRWTLMFLIDYVNFNAKWETPFTFQGTKRGLFKVNKLKTIEVKMMHQVGQFKTFKDHAHDCVVVQVPYTDQLVLLLIVPNNGDLDEVENQLSIRLIERYLNKAKTSLLDLYIPKVFVQKK
ncbi:alpha-1-antiproteinase-like [Bufo gargarizans]|uniref:alpha-1-antiproteinase-like n=1 Tax=Bufo gargarizans TaxID=30331 RepID=UPI001CF307B4|nr:alpha-1-antiproteinase-like [Bufo gargarizans]